MITSGRRLTNTCIAALAAVSLLTNACGGSRVAGAPAPLDRGCSAVTPTTAVSADSAAVILTWPIEPRNAPRPGNPGERFVYELGYETLVRVDCHGRVMPSLASSWATVDGGTRLQLTLRDSARFWSGDLLTVHDAMASWRVNGHVRLAESAVAVSERILQLDCNVFGAVGGRDCPLLAALGHPELAVSRGRPGTTWPEGTGPYRIGESASTLTGGARRSAFRLDPVRYGALPRLTIHSVRDAEARDLVDVGAQLVLTDDPALATYASARSDVISVTLPWDRTWAIVTPARRTAAAPGDRPSAIDPDTIALRTYASRVTLARDVVRADARASEDPYWWRNVSACTWSTPVGDPPSERLRPRVATRGDQPIARALAERLVALAATSRGTTSDSLLAVLAPLGLALDSRSTAVSLPPNDFAAALRTGSETAYVVAVPRHSLVPCLDADRLRSAAPWLWGGSMPQAPSFDFVPLVDTRLRAIVRREWIGLTTTWDSTVTIPSR